MNAWSAGVGSEVTVCATAFQYVPGTIGLPFRGVLFGFGGDELETSTDKKINNHRQIREYSRGAAHANT
jgi:hypothetical protein